MSEAKHIHRLVSEMTNYRRNFIPRGIFLFAVNLAERSLRPVEIASRRRIIAGSFMLLIQARKVEHMGLGRGKAARVWKRLE